MNRLAMLWAGAGLVLVACSAVLAVFSPSFGYAAELIDMPILAYVSGYMLAGLLLFAVLFLLRRTQAEGWAGRTNLLLWIVAAGLVMRLIQFAAEPVLEDDYQRYLWDGAVTAEGGNPYKYAPEKFLDEYAEEEPFKSLEEPGAQVLERINYPQYRTIYPPVTQAFFALAHKIYPFSLTAWRTVLLALDIGILGLIVFLLGVIGRPVIWCALYWWNPLVVKELFNSVHMEPVLMLFVLAGLALLVSQKTVAASAALAVAAGAKLWPVILMPLLLRSQLGSWPRLLLLAATFGAIAGVLFLPVVLSNLDSSSGFVAYAGRWQTNSAMFLGIEWLAGLWPFAWPATGLLARGIAGGLLFASVIAICRLPIEGAEDVLRRAFWCCVALFLLSPSQFPWYFLWVAPFLPLFPLRGLLLAVVLMPLYYVYFHLSPRDMAHIQTYGVVWLLWLPVWSLLLFDVYAKRRGRPARF